MEQLPLQAKIIEIKGFLVSKSIDEVMSMDWSRLAIKRDKDWVYGRYVGRRFYTQIEDNKTFKDESLAFSIEFMDTLNPDGSVKEFIRGNTAYIEINEKKRIVVGDPDGLDEDGDLDDLTQIKSYLVEKSTTYKKRRNTLIFNMVAKNRNTSIEDSVKLLHEYYFDLGVITEFIQTGNNTFQDAIINASTNGTPANILTLLANKMIIGFDGVVGATSGTIPLYYAIPNGSGGWIELTLKDIILHTISFWK